jgi:hypothetical protein
MFEATIAILRDRSAPEPSPAFDSVGGIRQRANLIDQAPEEADELRVVPHRDYANPAQDFMPA